MNLPQPVSLWDGFSVVERGGAAKGSSGGPYATISDARTMYLNDEAIALMGGATHALLMVDKDWGVVALRPATSETAHAFRLSYQHRDGKVTGASLSVVGAARLVELPRGSTVTFAVEGYGDGLMLDLSRPVRTVETARGRRQSGGKAGRP